MNGYCRLTINDEIAVLVDEEDFGLLSGKKWYRVCAGRKPYASTSVNGRAVLLHRLLMGEPPGLFVDHVNGDTLDNRRANLRVCTRAENCRNRGRTRANSTGFKGVFAHKNGGFTARIGANGHSHYLGKYRTSEDAARAYDAAALNHHGDFAVLNLGAA